MEKEFLGKEDNDLLVRYLLGDLSETERERVEEEYFVNQEAWSALGAAEDDLIDSYVRGELSPSRREQFERHFLASSRKRKRVEFALALMNPAAREAFGEQTSAEPKRRALFPQIGQAAAMFASIMAGLVIAAIALLLIQNQRLRKTIDNMHGQEAERQHQIESAQQQMAHGQEAGAASGSVSSELPSAQLPTVSLLLTPDLLRNNAGNSQGHMLPILTMPSIVTLQLYLERDEYPGYDVVFRTAEGKQVSHLQGLKSQPVQQGGRAVAVHLSSRSFRRGDYVITLSGKGAEGKYQVVDSYSLSVVQ